jgi:sugar/nucleoside kinase (ribokinase family)
MGEAFYVTPSRVPAVDTTGAGDAFRAGLMYALLQGWGLRESVGVATAAGSLKVSRLGAATDVPSIEEVVAVADGLRIDAG